MGPRGGTHGDQEEGRPRLRRLLETWRTRPGITDELVEGIVEATRELDLYDILIKGQPHPDYVRVAATTDDPERCGTVVTKILTVVAKAGGQFNPTVRTFPRGIPHPREYVLDVTLGEQQTFQG